MARSERAQYRKTQQMLEQTHGGNAGRSIIGMLQEQLNAAGERYVTEMLGGTQKGMLIARGEIRGLARAVATMQNPYHPTRGIKELEKDAVARAREKHHGEVSEHSEPSAE